MCIWIGGSELFRLKLGKLVDLIGFEPMTSSMPWKRAPNCATGPLRKIYTVSYHRQAILKLRPAIVILGSTASGKSDLALELAQRFDGEIVNCDSVQLYRYLDIGTAKTPPQDRRGIPHHLIDIVNPDEVFTAGQYQRVARPLLVEIASRGRLPIIVGG